MYSFGRRMPFVRDVFCEASSPAPFRAFIVLDKGMGADGKVCALLLFASILAFGISSADVSAGAKLLPS